MADSIQQVISDGTLVSLDVSIPYIDQEDIFFYVDDVLAAPTYTIVWVTATQISITPAIPLGAEFAARRRTKSATPLHVFGVGNAVFSDVAVDENFKQALYIAQEAIEGGGATDYFTDIDMHQNKLVNLGKAVNGGDSISYQQFKDERGAFSNYTNLGDYAAGLVFTSYIQTFRYNGEFYAPSASITLPYTTTGVGAAEIASFSSVGDAVLRSDLASPGGAQLVEYQGRTVYDRLGEAISPMDFGAIGDGVTDDTAAVQAALNDSLNIVGGGSGRVYRVAGTLNLLSGHYLDLGASKFVQTLLQTPLFDCVGKDSVTVKGGVYEGVLESPYFNSPSSLAICFKAELATNLSITGAKFKNFCYSPLMVNSGGYNIEFSRNTVEGPASVLTADINYRNTTGATITGSNIRVSGNDIRGTAQGLIIGQGSSNVVVADNIIHDLVNEHGMYVDTGVKNVSITGNVIRYTGAHGVGIKVQHYDSFGVTPENIVISGNTIYASGSDGILVINTAGTNLYATGVSITGNSIYQAGQHGIDVRYARNCVISGNTIEAPTQSGIYASKCSVLDVLGNSIRLTGSHGVFDDGTNSDVVYANNIINSPGTSAAASDSGFLVQGCSEHSFINNVVRGTTAKTAYGLFIIAGSLNTTEVRGNSFTGNLQLGYRFPAVLTQIRYLGENKVSGAAGQDVGQYVPLAIVRGSEDNLYYGTAVPTTGTWSQGSKVINVYPAAAGFIGWVCVVGGTPGTWRTYGLVSS